MSVACTAAVVGSFVSKRVGRRPAMIMAGAFFLVGAVLLAAAAHVAMLILGRVIMGLGKCVLRVSWLHIVGLKGAGAVRL